MIIMRPLQRRVLSGDLMPRRSTICPNCCQPQANVRTRAFSSAAAASTTTKTTMTFSPPRPPPSSGIAPLSSRQILSVGGPDAAKFLQGLVTANITAKDGLPKDHGIYAGFLTATGRVMHDVFIYPNTSNLAGAGEDHPGFLIEADAQQMSFLARYIKRYKLRAKVTIRTVQPGELTIWQAWNDEAAPEDSLSLHKGNTSGILLKDPRAPGLGYRIVQSGDKAPDLRIGLEQAPEDAYTVRRYLRGVPEGQSEIIKEQALPQESNMDLMNGIDFRKGCYVGQELTIRTRHRGVVRKRILPCVVYGADEPVAPQSLHYDPGAAPASPSSADAIPADTSIGRVGKRGRSAGKWLRGVGNIGLGLCRLEIMTGVTLPGETAAATYQPDHEFMLEWAAQGEENIGDAGGDAGGDGKSRVKVKAFVPDWIKSGLDTAAAEH